MVMADSADFEKEKWRADLEIRQREISLKERDQDNRDAEIQLKREEQASAKWRSPLVVAIFAAAAAATGNAVVATISGYDQRQLESSKHTAEIALENSKAESTRILEMIKTGDTEKAASNLEFLLKSGLVAEQDRVKKLAEFLAKRAPGAGPSLPAAAPRFAFEPTDVLTHPLQATLQKLLDEYVAYLDRIEFPKTDKRVTIKVDKLSMANAYYSSSDNTILIDHRLVDDPVVALREYSLHVLASRAAPPRQGRYGQYDAIESGMADYLACTFLNNPKVGELAAKVSDAKAPYIRTLLNERKFSEFKIINELAFPSVGPEIWGGAFWEIRTRLSREVADPIFVTAWLTMVWPTDETLRASAFVEALLSSARARKLSEPNVELIRSIMSMREFPVSK